MTIRPDDRTKWHPLVCLLGPEETARIFPAGPLLRKAVDIADAAIMRMLLGGAKA